MLKNSILSRFILRKRDYLQYYLQIIPNLTYFSPHNSSLVQRICVFNNSWENKSLKPLFRQKFNILNKQRVMNDDHEAAKQTQH